MILSGRPRAGKAPSGVHSIGGPHLCGYPDAQARVLSQGAEGGTQSMEAIEERLIKLERQLRFYRRLTIGITASLVLFFGWIGYMVVTTPKSFPVGPTYGKGVFLLDQEGQALASLTAKREGVVQLNPERWSWTSSETRPSGASLITFDVSGDTPSLVLTDIAGNDVWRAP